MRLIVWHLIQQMKGSYEVQTEERWREKERNPTVDMTSVKGTIRGGSAIGPNNQQEHQRRPTSASVVEKLATGSETAESKQRKTTTITKDKFTLFDQGSFSETQMHNSLKEKICSNSFVYNKNEKKIFYNSLEEKFCFNDPLDVNNCVVNSLEEENCVNISLEDSDIVKGKLRKHIKKWEQIGANKFILDTIKNGYKLPFIDTPKPKMFINNNSALAETEFVSSTIADLLSSGSIVETRNVPKVVSPLGVSRDSSGKKRLIIDLRYVNEHLCKEFISFDDWREFQNFVKPNGFLFKFDLRKGYHHVDIFSEHQDFLGFSWTENNTTRFFIFTVLPFGLSPAPNVFTKLLRVLVRQWHQQGIKISVYIDDGGGAGDTYEEAFLSSGIVRKLLIDCGFVINEKKSIWEPTKSLTWLGVKVDLIKNIFHISDNRIQSLLNSCEKLLSSPYTTARTISRLAGKIVSMKFVLLNIVRLKTRFLYKTIDLQTSWDSRLNVLLFPEAHLEIIFWRDNILRLNKRNVSPGREIKTVVCSDASDYAAGAVFVHEKMVSHKNLSPIEKTKSSTWRELEGIRFSLIAFKEILRNSSVLWKTDNYATSLIVDSGSRKIELQQLAIEIYEITQFNNITLKVQWIPRDENIRADFISKVIDVDDWQLSEEFFNYLNNLWGPFSIDRFANHYNTKTERFNSRFFVPGTEGVDTFMQDWRGENNLFVPPVKDILRTVNRIESNKNIVGTLVIPHWTSKPYWAVKFNSFIIDSVYITDAALVLRHGMFNGSLLGSESFHSGIWALRILSN